MKLALHWFRRDLRVHDNTAFSRAVSQAERVVPVFILEDALRTGPDVGAARLAFLLRSLDELRTTLKELGYPLIVRRGRSEQEIPALARELGAEAVFCNKRYEPYAQARDARVFNALNSMGVGFELIKDSVIWEEQEILTKGGTPYTVFTPYSKVWRERKIPPPLPRIPHRAAFPVQARSEEIPLGPQAFGHPLTQSIPEPGENAALRQLEQFAAGPLKLYARGRDFPALEGTSCLSPHLRCGTISVRTVLAEVRKVRAACPKQEQESFDIFINELIWREFYLQILHNFPHVMKGSFRPEYNELHWSDNQEHFQAWCHGMTGYPIIDAAMRCLNATSWMHNRLRMIVAMFLTKDLLINWQRGERYFMQQLVDGDMAANNGGWQWSAGTGTDAAPYFRIFNPVTQGQKFDPQGDFIRRWVSEIAGLSGKEIHEPWKQPLLAGKYPAPIIEHSEQRKKALAMYEKVKTRRAPRAGS